MDNENEIKNTGRNPNNLTVQKSNALTSLWKSKLTLAEFKILDTYLSRINSRIPEKKTVLFNKGKLENLLGVKRIRREELESRLINLMSNVVEVTDKDEKKGFKLITLFEEADAELDDDGLWQIKLTCTDTAMKYIFNIEHIGYLRYKLRCITSLKSRQAYILFMYLEMNRFRKEWEIDIEELKELLGCKNSETYKQYKRFNDLVLKRIHRELHERTECKYEYVAVKKGRYTVAIRFIVETNPLIEVDYSNPNDCENQENLWISVLCDDETDICEFNENELDILRNLLKNMPKSMLTSDNEKDINIARADYIALKYAMMNNQKSKINDRFAYLKKMIEKDIEKNKQKKEKKDNSFNNFQQRTYDYEALEKEMLGNIK